MEPDEESVEPENDHGHCEHRDREGCERARQEARGNGASERRAPEQQAERDDHEERDELQP